MKIYIPYFVNTFDNKEELDRKIGLVVRHFLEGEANTTPSIFSVTFVSLNMSEYKDWLATDDDSEEAKEQFMRGKIIENDMREERR